MPRGGRRIPGPGKVQGRPVVGEAPTRLIRVAAADADRLEAWAQSQGIRSLREALAVLLDAEAEKENR